MAFVRCNVCGYELSPAVFQGGMVPECPACHRKVTAKLLPAVYKSQLQAAPPALPEEPPAPGEAACFYNPNRRATKVCDHCGVFVSDAWAAKWGGQTVCLKCLDQLRNKEKDTRFQAKRTLWDNVALACAIGPFVLAAGFLMTLIGYPFAIMCLLLTFVTAPAAIFISLRFWKAPRSLVPRGPWRMISALVLGLLQVVGWGTAIVAIYMEAVNQ